MKERVRERIWIRIGYITSIADTRLQRDILLTLCHYSR